MNLIVSFHLRQSSDLVATRLAAAATLLAVGTPLTHWVDENRTVFRAQFRVRPEALTEPFGAFVRRLQAAAGAHLQQLILVGSTDVGGAAHEPAYEPTPTPVSGSALIVKAPLTEAERAPGHTRIMSPAQAAVPVGRESPTLMEIPKVAPSPRTIAASGEVEPIAFAVRSARKETINGFVIATGQPLTLRPTTPFDVVEGEVLVFRPVKFWRFARQSIATGEFIATRIAPGVFGGRPLRLVGEGAALEFERPVLEGDLEDPADDPIADARLAMREERGSHARALLRGAIEENVRCLDAHNLLAVAELTEGNAERAARHDEVLLAFADEAAGPGFVGVLEGGMPGNRPVRNAVDRLESGPSTPARQALVALWRPRLR